MKNRWLIALSAVGIHLSIGSVYAWSNFTNPLKLKEAWPFLADCLSSLSSSRCSCASIFADCAPNMNKSSMFRRPRKVENDVLLLPRRAASHAGGFLL